MDKTFSASRRRLLAGAGSAALMGVAAWTLGRPAAASPLHVLQGSTMASTWSVKLHAPGLDPGGLAQARSAVDAALANVVARMSTFDAASELSRFNRRASDRPIALSQDLVEVLRTAETVSAASRGAFDVTIAPVVDAWGFGPGGGRARPAAADLALARARVGWQALELDSASGAATKAHPGLAIDLSGIAQGYASDRVAQALDALGFTDYLVDICGEIRARGLNADRRPWRLGIERPDSRIRTAHRIVPLSGQALATSGDYRIYFEDSGLRYSHEIDPATGAPARHALASVSVVAADAATADAWSTALFVAGPVAGYELARANGLAAYFIERTVTPGAAEPTVAPGAAGAAMARGPITHLVERATPAFEALGSWRA